MSSADDVTQVLSAISGHSPGTVLAERFRLVKLLGNGSYGSVFLADDMHLHCQVALKILRADLLQAPDATDKVRQEILVARTISHPNVIRVHDFYLSAEHAFFTMDYIDGCTMASLQLDSIESNAALVTQLGIQLIAATEAIHQQGILHCDISPHNILVAADNRLYLTDLGLASAMQDVTHQSCTPAYSAPEVLQTAAHSQASDYYAVASTLYQLITGTLPFAQTGLAEQLSAKLRQQPDLTVIKRHFPQWLTFFSENLAAYPQHRSRNAVRLKQLWLQAPQPTRKRMQGLGLMLGAGSLALLSTFLLWYVQRETMDDNTQTQTLTLPLTMAVMPVYPALENTQQRALIELVQQVLGEALRSSNVRIIPLQRVSTTLEHLGFTHPLTERQLRDLGNLLGADVLLSQQLTLLERKVDLAFTVTELRQPLLPVLWSQRQTVEQDSLSAVVSANMDQLLQVLRSHEAPGLATATPLPAAAQPLYQQVVLARTQQDEAAFLEGVSRLQQSFPQLAVGYLMAADWHQQRQNWLQAEQAYAQAVQFAAANSYDYLLAAARLAVLQERYTEADNHYQRLLAAKPFDTSLTLEYVELLSSQSRYALASEQLQRLATTDKTNPEIFLQLGKLAIRTGDINRAVDEYLLQAQVLYTRLKDKAGLADTLNALGVAMQRQGKFAESVPHYQEALSLFQQVDLLSGMAKASSNLGFVQLVSGAFTQAEDALKQALKYYQKQQDNYGVALNTDYLGLLEEEQGNYRKAQAYYTEAFSIRTRLDDSWELTDSLINLGYIYFVLSEFEQSQVYLKQAEQTAVVNNDALSLIKVRQILAQLKVQQGEWGQAFQLFKISGEDAAAIDLTEETLIAKAFLAKLAGLHGNFTQAEQQLLNFIEQAEQQANPRAAVEFRLWLVELYQHSAQYNKAAQQLALLKHEERYPSNNEQRQSLRLLNIYQLMASANLKAATEHLQQLQLNLQQQPLPRLEVKTFIVTQQLNLLQGQPLAAPTAEHDAILRHHVPERLLWLELQARVAAASGDREKVTQLLNQAMPLLRRATSYWRNFSFEYLQLCLNQARCQDQAMKVSDTAEFKRLLKNLPDEAQAAFIARENTPLRPADDQ